MTGRRIASIWFPRLAIQRWAKASAAQAETMPVGLVSQGPHGIVIDAVNRAGRAGGARPGQRLADARAVCPALAAVASDSVGDADALARLGRWAERWSPFVAVDGADGLLVDSTGAAHLFGGEAALATEIRARFQGMGLSARVAIAPTIGAAWGFARYGAGQPIICAEGALAAMIGALPVEALRLDGETALLLSRLGLKTIAALAAIPPRALARRFARADRHSSNPPLRLGQALGTIDEPVSPIVRAPAPRVVRRVAEPVLDVPVLMPVAAEMVDALRHRLAERHAGARHLGFQAFRVDGDVQLLEARTSRAMRDPAHMLRLFAERFETLDAGFGFDAFALTAFWHEPLDPAQAGLIEAETDATSLDRLVDRLSARLGGDNVSVPVFVQSHMPERALVWRPALGEARVSSARALRAAERPIRLFDRPEPIAVTYATPEGSPRLFQWRKRARRVVKIEGPERLAPEWWRERSTTRLRDYYRVEDAEGRRYWIFRNGVIGDGRGGAPDWYLHGLFA